MLSRQVAIVSLGLGVRGPTRQPLIRDGLQPWSGFASGRSLLLEKRESHGWQSRGTDEARRADPDIGSSITVVNERTGIFSSINANC